MAFWLDSANHTAITERIIDALRVNNLRFLAHKPAAMAQEHALAMHGTLNYH